MSSDRFLGFCGDIHGELKKLIWSLVERYKLSSGSLVVAGDFGAGFGRPGAMDVLYSSVKNRLENNDITIYVVRGNHDNPDWFDGQHDYPRVKFLKDHEVIEIEGKTIYPIGGAVSVDQEDRKSWNSEAEAYGSSKRWWWKDEIIEQKMVGLPERVDIIVSHEAPLYFEPVVVREIQNLTIWTKILESRKYLDYVLNEVKCSKWFHGHYHTSSSGSFGDVLYRGLDIDEIVVLYE